MTLNELERYAVRDEDFQAVTDADLQPVTDEDMERLRFDDGDLIDLQAQQMIERTNQDHGHTRTETQPDRVETGAGQPR